MTSRLFAEVIECASSGGDPLLLVHGFPFDHTMWQHQLGPLSQVCQVIAPDLRGFGQSPLTATDAETGVGMEQYAADLVELLDDLDVRVPVILCGFSMGGYILWQLSRLIPDRIKAMVLCDTRAVADSPEASAGRINMAEGVMASGPDPVAQAMLPKLLAAGTVAGRPGLVEEVTGMIRACSPAAIAAAQRGMARRPDVQDQLKGFAWPALVLCGAEDVISPPDEMRTLAESLPQARYCQIPYSGHMSPLENPEVFNAEVLKFVESL